MISQREAAHCEHVRRRVQHLSCLPSTRCHTTSKQKGCPEGRPFCYRNLAFALTTGPRTTGSEVNAKGLRVYWVRVTRWAKG